MAQGLYRLAAGDPAAGGPYIGLLSHRACQVLSRDQVVEKAAATADNQFVARHRPPGKTNAGCKIIPRSIVSIRMREVALKNSGGNGRTRVVAGKNVSLQSSHWPAACSWGGRNYGVRSEPQCRPEGAEVPQRLRREIVLFPPDPKVNGQAGRNFKVVLSEGVVQLLPEIILDQWIRGGRPSYTRHITLRSAVAPIRIGRAGRNCRASAIPGPTDQEILE